MHISVRERDRILAKTTGSEGRPHEPVRRRLLGSKVGACIVTLACLTACDDRSPDTDSKAVPDPPASIFSDEMHLRDGPGPILAVPRWAGMTSSGTLLVGDRSDRDIKLYSASTGERLGTLGRSGEGPGEFRVLASGFAVGETVFGFDMSSATLHGFFPDGKRKVFRFFLEPGAPRPMQVWELDGSHLLVVGSPIGTNGSGLVRILDWDGEEKAVFMDMSDFFEGTPALFQFTQVVADGHDGCVFAGLSRDNRISAFSINGYLIGQREIDIGEPWVPLPVRLEENGGEARTADGGWVHDGDPYLAKIVALPGCRALVQVGRYDAAGTDRLEGGHFLLFEVTADRELVQVAHVAKTGALMGRDAQNRPLHLAYGQSTEEYVMTIGLF